MSVLFSINLHNVSARLMTFYADNEEENELRIGVMVKKQIANSANQSSL
jgi:hypothetical protein